MARIVTRQRPTRLTCIPAARGLTMATTTHILAACRAGTDSTTLGSTIISMAHTVGTVHGTALGTEAGMVAGMVAGMTLGTMAMPAGTIHIIMAITAGAGRIAMDGTAGTILTWVAA